MARGPVKPQGGNVFIGDDHVWRINHQFARVNGNGLGGLNPNPAPRIENFDLGRVLDEMVFEDPIPMPQAEPDEPEDDFPPDPPLPRREAPFLWNRAPDPEDQPAVPNGLRLRKQRAPAMDNIKAGPTDFRGLTERTTRLPRFKLKYATDDEARMRLEGTFVTIQDRMVKVCKIQQVRQGDEVGTGCIALNESGHQEYLLFTDEGLNLRSPDPGYIQLMDTTVLFRRKPARVYKQGINGENSIFSRVGKEGDRWPVFGRYPDHVVCEAFNNRSVHRFTPELMEDKSSLRLSDRIAVFKRNGGKLHVEHRGYYLGPLIRNTQVKVDALSPWTCNALAAVGLEAVEG